MQVKRVPVFDGKIFQCWQSAETPEVRVTHPAKVANTEWGSDAFISTRARVTVQYGD